MNLNEMIEDEIRNGYGDLNAQAKVCQDIILRAIAKSSLSRNVTIKGGVVMRGKTNNVRRATQDIDIDFIRYSLSDESIELFVHKLNCIQGIKLERVGKIETLNQQDYQGKRIYIKVSDEENNSFVSKLDIGVHKKLEIEQEEFCFEVAMDEEGASLLINSNEQMFVEKLRSLLRFGFISTRYKDIYDMYYLSDKLNPKRLEICLETYIFKDPRMREKDIAGIIRRVSIVFADPSYQSRLASTDQRWLDEDIQIVLKKIESFLKSINK